MRNILHRGDIWWVDLGIPEQGSSRQGGKRPAILNSCNKVLNNERCTIINVIPITSKISKQITHIPVNKECGLLYNSMAEVEQSQKLDKSKMLKPLGKCTKEIMKQINMVSKIDTGEVDITYVYFLAGEIKDINETIAVYRSKNLTYDKFEHKRNRIFYELRFYCDKFKENIHKVLKTNRNKLKTVS